ncbi:MAG: hypothetical protein K6A44_00275 [bacterium]|nr:hypothetical protein [bacterium]
MTVTANFGLLSGTGSQALQSFYASSTNRKVLNGISGGFCSSRIFSNSSGLGSTAQLASATQLTGSIPGRVSSVYSGAGFGSSLVGNYYNSISSVVVGQQAPTSVFEQRLAYAFGNSNPTASVDYPTGNYSNLFSSSATGSSSSSSTKSSSSSSTKTGTSYDVFSTTSTTSTTSNYDYSKASTASSVSSLISALSVMG